MNNILKYKCTCGGNITEEWHWKKSKVVCNNCLIPVAQNEPKVEFERSILNARDVGVPEEKILKTHDDIDNYFMN